MGTAVSSDKFEEDTEELLSVITNSSHAAVKPRLLFLGSAAIHGKLALKPLSQSSRSNRIYLAHSQELRLER
jgi:hypothetical protein